MALNKEDKADVSRSMGKALANKVSKVTKDKGVTHEKSNMKGDFVKNLRSIQRKVRKEEGISFPRR